MDEKVIAVDFDGTLCEANFPWIGRPRWEIIDALKKEIDEGARVILWTCRSDEEGGHDYLTQAVEWCAKELDLTFDAVNEDIPGRKFGTSRKVNADEFWDDKAKEV